MAVRAGGASTLLQRLHQGWGLPKTQNERGKHVQRMVQIHFEGEAGRQNASVFRPRHVYLTFLGMARARSSPHSTPTPSRAESGERRRDRPVSHQSHLKKKVRLYSPPFQNSRRSVHVEVWGCAIKQKRVHTSRGYISARGYIPLEGT